MLTSTQRLSKPPVQGAEDRSRAAVAVHIRYCVPSRYRTRAAALARSIEGLFGIRPDLIAARGGVFEVEVAGRLIFSKRASDRLPDDDEIHYHVRAQSAVSLAGSEGNR